MIYDSENDTYIIDDDTYDIEGKLYLSGDECPEWNKKRPSLPQNAWSRRQYADCVYPDYDYHFHCGENLVVLINGVWVPTHFELGYTPKGGGPENGGWYLVGLEDLDWLDMTARR